MANGVDLDKIFCLMAKKYQIPKLILKAIGIVESSLNPRAYRYEPGLWNAMKSMPEWANRNGEEVAASYGIMQLLYTTAKGLGWPEGDVEDLYNPVINIELGAKLMRQNLDNVLYRRLHIKYGLWPLAIALARYNGGAAGNPSELGKLRNFSYVMKVMREWEKLVQFGEEDCVNGTGV